MKKPHITFHQDEYGIFVAKVHGQLSWEPMLIAYGYGFSIHSAVSRAWERWKAQENSDIEFSWQLQQDCGLRLMIALKDPLYSTKKYQ